MLYYRYFRSHWRETLETTSFKMASLADFNDPFDGRGRCVGTLAGEGANAFVAAGNPLTSMMLGQNLAVKTYEQQLRTSVQNRTLFSEMKILCLSACEDGDPAQKLMWAHYANGYSGVRMGLQINDPKFSLFFDSVKYCHERPVLDFSKVRNISNDAETLRFWIANLTTKSTEWAYEREYRIIADAQHLIPGKDAQGHSAWFWRFDADALKCIDVGCKVSQDEVDEIVGLTRARYRYAKVRRAVLSELSYDISYETVYESP